MEHQRALPVGTRIEEYRLETVLGAGGFGITYRAHDTNLAKTVAIKEYLPAELATRTADSTVVPNSSADADDYAWGLQRFLDEARTLARFDHPHLNKVYRFFEAHGTAYLVLDYVEGEPLSAVLRRQGTLPADELERLLTDVLSGLEAVHAAGYVHRDVKPGNLMVRPDGSTVLLDFGAARQAIGQRSKSVTAILTPGYAPIEQYDSTAEDVGPWSDLYALGMVAYRCVSGLSDAELPDAVTRSRNARKGAADLPPAVEVGNGRYPHKLLATIDHAIQVNEEDRPQNVAAWRAKAVGHQDRPAAPASAPKATLVHRSPASAPRRGWAGVAIIVVAVIGGGAYLLGRPDPGAVETALGLGRAEQRLVQQGLAAAGQAPGPVDGLFGAGRGTRTRSALRAWQAVKGFEETGYLTREQADTLIAQGRQANARQTEQNAALRQAAKDGDTDSLKTLLAGGAQPDVQDRHGWTALKWAAYMGDIASVRALLAGGAQPDVQDKDGNTALMSAAYMGHTASVEALLAGGARPDVQDKDGETALMDAASKGHTASVEALLAGGAEPNVPDKYGITAIDFARSKGHAEIVRLLEAAGGR